MPNIFSNLFRSTKKSFSSKDDPAFQAYTQFLGLGNPVYTPKDYAVLAKEGFEKNVTVYKGVSLIAQSCAGIPWKLYQRRNKLTEIDSHPLLDLLANPNARYSQGEFIEQMVSFWILSGNTYVTTVRPNVRALPSELWVLRPDRMRVVPGISTISGYEYYVDGLRSYFAAPDILHLKMFAATNDWYGLSPVMVAASLVDQQNEGFDWNTALIQNSGRPSGALVANGTLSSDQYERLRRVIRERYVGKKNAGMPMLLEGGIDWKPFSLSPLELDWKESRTLNMRDISIALGVPPELMGDSSNKTYSNYGEARKSFYQETVLPLMDKLRDRLNVWLVSQYGDDLYLNYDKEEIEALQEDRDSLSGRMLAQWEAGVVTLNEAREALGLDEIPGGDVLQLNASTYIYIPTASLSDVIEQKLENLLAPPPPPPAAIAAPISAPDPADPKTDTAPEDASSGPEKDATAPVGDKVGKQPIPLKKPTPLPSPKQPQAKSWEGSTEIKATKDPQVLALEKTLQTYFAAEKKRVLLSVKRAALPQTVSLRFERILGKQQGVLTDLLLKENRPLAEKSGEKVLQRLGETKRAAPVLEPVLSQQAQASAARVQETTRLALIEAMDYGIAKNETVDELAQRIEDVYDGDMQGWRARQIAQTEVTRTTNYGMYAAAYSLQAPVQKTWVTVGDERVRPSHQAVAGMVLNLDESFGVAGENMLYPGDLESGATASNVINCRCTIDYLLAGKAGGVPEEKDNPNHGPNGQFTFGSGGAGGGAGANVPKKGKVLEIKELAALPASLAQDTQALLKNGSQDPYLAALLHAQGFDGPPTLVDSLSSTDAVLFRGVTEKVQAEQFQSGPLYVGKGILGNGTYVASGEDIQTNLELAKVYAGENGAVLKMTLHPDAKVGNYDTVMTQSHEDYIKAADIYENKIDAASSKEERAKLRAERDVVRRTYVDVGTYATSKGYDALEYKPLGQTIVYNRTALIIEKKIL